LNPELQSKHDAPPSHLTWLVSCDPVGAISGSIARSAVALSFDRNTRVIIIIIMRWHVIPVVSRRWGTIISSTVGSTLINILCLYQSTMKES
jgi:hypothetical protein